MTAWWRKTLHLIILVVLRSNLKNHSFWDVLLVVRANQKEVLIGSQPQAILELHISVRVVEDVIYLYLVHKICQRNITEKAEIFLVKLHCSRQNITLFHALLLKYNILVVINHIVHSFVLHRIIGVTNNNGWYNKNQNIFCLFYTTLIM